ncbi:DUF4422 domain-containing protein [Enorma massiliensis]|uniref:DUF4422 domain-containing protein n=1 Tax=Enorma massiliensis TaxID=1472761 RepID=A0A1Y3U921_9ACTN|nr:DUF4422 domain-containing protein [Enorma massiliensis]OUN44615.1 hypothetical protein B5G21_01405 [Enorma massiliensis]
MKVYIAAHAYCEVPHPYPYQPLFVGAYKLPKNERKPDWEFDDGFLGNISENNSTYCELTGLKWIWKKTQEDIVGLVHYRRFLASPLSPSNQPYPLSEQEIRNILEGHDCIVAQKAFLHDGSKNCSVAKHYRIHHSSTDLIKAKMVIGRYYPEYSDAFDKVMRNEFLSPFNIIICNRQLFNAYAQWLFGVEHRLAQAIDPLADRPPYQQRVFGFLAERLLNVYIVKHNLSAFACKVFNPMDPTRCTPGMSTPLQYEAITNPTGLEHLSKVRDGIDYSPVFDYSFYFNNYRDIAAAFSENPSLALDHFLINGAREGRVAHPNFSITSYVNGNPHLWLKYDNPIAIVRHYLDDEGDRRHAIGYENLLCSPGTTIERNSSPASRIKRLRLERWTNEAESKPVLDGGL